MDYVEKGLYAIFVVLGVGGQGNKVAVDMRMKENHISSGLLYTVPLFNLSMTIGRISCEILGRIV